MLRNILSVIAGLAASAFVILIGDWIRLRIARTATELNDPENSQAMLIILAIWGLGAFTAGIVATIIARPPKIWQALFTGVIITGIGIIYMFMVPHPVWFWIAGAAVFLPFTWLGSRLILLFTAGSRK